MQNTSPSILGTSVHHLTCFCPLEWVLYMVIRDSCEALLQMNHKTLYLSQLLPFYRQVACTSGHSNLNILSTVFLWLNILHQDDTIKCFETIPELHVNFALYIHKHKASCKANSHNHQLGPEGPVQVALTDF